eukprot:COSAG02_NODE_3153_length_7266_cov_6.588531_4_plen_35_part_00
MNSFSGEFNTLRSENTTNFIETLRKKKQRLNTGS